MIDVAGTHTMEVAHLDGDYTVRAPDGTHARLPAFRWADGRAYVRFRAHEPGVYEVVSADGTSASVECRGGRPPAPHLESAGRTLRTSDGDSFLWLADTWWYALSGRVTQDELAELGAQRRAQGFTAVQVVAGLLPEVYTFDDLGALDGVWPWTSDLENLEPRWWDSADERIRTIIEAGLVPAIVGAWSYYMLDLGSDRIERHWREAIARWSALPVMWCIAGEAGLPHYMDVGGPDESRLVSTLTEQWHAVTLFVRDLDPYSNLRTIHPCPAFDHFSSVDVTGDPESIDVVWLQTGHADRSSISPSLSAAQREIAADHGLPVINSEVCYEGIAAGSGSTLQRFLFWAHILSGAAGHTYGAQGLWAFRRAHDPGPGLAWGDATWQEAAELPGARQLGAAAELLRGLGWGTLAPSPASLSVHADSERRAFPYAARDAQKVIAYFPAASLLPMGTGISQDLSEATLCGLEPGGWTLTWWNPRAGTMLERREIQVGDDGVGVLGSSRGFTAMPSMEDWILIAESSV